MMRTVASLARSAEMCRLSLDELVFQAGEAARGASGPQFLVELLRQAGHFAGFGSPGEFRLEVILRIARAREHGASSLEASAVAVVDALAAAEPDIEPKLADALCAAELNSFGRALLDEVVDRLGRPKILTLRHRGRLIYGMVRRRPEVAASAEFWRSSTGVHDDIVDALAAAKPPETLLRAVLTAMIASGTGAKCGRLLEYPSRAAIWAALDWMAEGARAPEELGIEWRRHLASSAELVVEWLIAHPEAPLETVSAAVRYLDASAEAVSHTELWTALDRRVSKTSRFELIPLRAFLLSRAFIEDAAVSLELIENGFLAVHSAICDGTVDAVSWDALERHLPTVESWLGWDRAERLRRGIILLLSRHRGSLAKVIRGADASTVQLITKSCRESNEGTLLLQRETGLA